MKGHIVMSTQELLAVDVFERLLRNEITQVEAGSLLGITDRQVRRKLPKYKEFGVKSLIHGNRGKPSGRKISSETRDQIVQIIKDKYYDFGPTLLQEKLEENHQIKLSRELIRQLMIKVGIHKPKRRKQRKVYQLRERRTCFGELIQADGSPHAWFENRAPKCNLTVLVDDATGKPVWLELNQSESINSYFRACEGYFLKHGLPLALYVDKHGVFKINNYRGQDFKKPSIEELRSELTQFGRAMEELGVELIFANSPQAKGRVEKLNQTLQDRLVKELRFRNISTIDAANQYLPEFIKKYSTQFGVEPKSRVDMHRPIPRSINLKKILSVQTNRTLSRQFTCQYDNTLYQIQTSNKYCLRQAIVQIREDYHNQITIWYKNKQLDYTVFRRRPKVKMVDSKQLNPEMEAIKHKHLKSLENRVRLPKSQWETPTNEMTEQIYV